LSEKQVVKCKIQWIKVFFITLCAADAEKNCFSYEKSKTSMIENTYSNGDGQKIDPINYKILDQNRLKVSLVYPQQVSFWMHVRIRLLSKEMIDFRWPCLTVHGWKNIAKMVFWKSVLISTNKPIFWLKTLYFLVNLSSE
jgi:hypothetical protein